MSLFVVIISLHLLFVFFNAVVCIDKWKPHNPVRQPVCTAPKCLAEGVRFTSNLKTSVHPCKNFYDFVCGNWAKHNQPPKFAAEWTVQTLMIKDVLKSLKQILDNGRFHQKEYIQAKIVHDTCKQIPTYPRKEPKEIQREVEAIGRPINRKNIWDIHNRYLALTGDSALFGYAILAQIPYSDIPMFILTELDSAYGALFHDIQWKTNEEAAYMEYLNLLLKTINYPAAQKELWERLRKVFEFRKVLNEIVEKNRKLSRQPVGPMTPSELENLLLDTLQKPKGIKNIPIRSIAEILLKNIKTEVLESSPIVGLRRMEYFDELKILLGETSNDVLGLHMELYFLERHLAITPHMDRLLTSSSTEPSAHVQYIRPDIYERWEFCLLMYNDQLALGRLYISQSYPLSYNRQVNDILLKVGGAMKRQMAASTWLRKSTRAKIEKKIDGMKKMLGFPSWYKEPAAPLPSNADEYNVLIPRAVYEEQANTLYIMAPLMLSQFNQELPTLYNYAGIGATVGHLLYHIISNCGTYLYQGRFKHVWWTNDMRRHCAARKMCFIKFYDLITATELQNRFKLGHQKVDTGAKFTESYPDVMGLQAAYNAYKEEVKLDKNVCKVLPMMDEYNCDQLFFIAFANNYCGEISPRSAKFLLVSTLHNPPSVRVNAAVSNNDAFIKAFDCPVDSPMNPRKKCDLWK